MQPPPQAAPSGVVGPPPVGNPQGVFWSNSAYRRRVNGSTPVAPITGPLQPVTDPFAFSRQALQNASLGGLSKSSPPIMQGPVLSQHPGPPAPHTDEKGLHEPLPRPFSQPRADASPPGPARNRNSDVGPSSGPDVQPAPHPAQHVPGVGPDGSHGGRPLRRQNPPGGAAAPAASSFFPQPHHQMPDPWGLVQGSPQPSGQQYPPCPEGAIQNAVPRVPGIPHFPPQPAMHQAPGHEQPNPLVSLPGPWTGDERSEVFLQSGNHSAKDFEPDNPFGQNPIVGNPWAGQEFRQNIGVNKEHLPEPAVMTPLAQGNSPENHLHYPLGVRASCIQPEAGLGSLSMFFQGGETENEENLPSEKTGLLNKSDFDGFSPGPGLGHPLPPTPVGAGGIYQAFLKGSSSETTQQGGDTQPYFPQPAGSHHDRQVPKNAAVDMWGDTASAGAHDAIGPQHENVENLEFLQNQEVLPSEPLGVNPSPLSEPFRSGPVPAPTTAKHGAGNLAGGGGTNLEAPDMAPQPMRSDSVSSSYSSKNHRALSSSTRPQELLGTFIQQEVGKPEEDVSGSFFKQIDSSPVGGEADETTVSPNYHNSLSQPSTPSPPKPTGVFQTSANSSFEPVKSHLVGVKPVEADRANVVGEVRGTRARQRKRKPVAVLADASPGNLEQPPDNVEALFTPQLCPLPPATALRTGGPPSQTALPVPENRPSARAQGAAKCESPATTLWAQNELPDFGGNVLLAPAAPALYVPAKPQPSEVIQPPDEAASGHQLRKPGSTPPLQNQDGLGASENLENPPKMGEEEALQSQASSGYASLLSSPPTESLQNQPVLIAQPDQSYNLAQPINFSMSLSHHNEKSRSWKDALVVGDKPTLSSRALGDDPGEKAPLSGIPASSLVSLPLPNTLAQSSFPPSSGTSEVVSNQPASLLAQPPSHLVPVNLVPESQRSRSAENVLPEFVTGPAGSAGVVLVPPASNTSVPVDKADHCGAREEISGAIDFSLNRTLEHPVGMYTPPHPDGPAAAQQTVASHPGQPGPGVRGPGHFHPQLTKDVQNQKGFERTQQESGPPQQQASAPHVPKATCSEASNPGSPPAQGQSQSSAQPPASPVPANTSQQLLPRPPRSSSASVTSTGSSQAAGRLEQPWQHLTPPGALGPPPQDLSYYYYRPLYDAYTAQYPSLYLPDPGTASLYYQQDVYGLYRPYDGSASTYAENYRYPEPERPSSRASHSSDRPPPRQGFPDGYYNAKGGWSSQSDYYANYYSSRYDYGDPSRWDRYHYGSGFRDSRPCDRRYWYGADDDPYRKELCAYGDRPESDEGHWRYDPRITGSFDDDPEPPRDPYGDEGDRRSVHSEHSAHSLHSTRSLQSRRSSFSTHSHQSQIYRSHHVPASSYEVPAPPGSFQGDYAYGAYGSNFNPAQGFSEYGYAADTGWPAVQQAPSRPTSPEKFSVPHICARFGPGGQLIKVIPNLPSEGQPALVEVHSMETLLQHTPEQEEMRAFPGPLGKDDTHKVDVINFAQNKATKCFRNENLIDKESASLLWDFIVLLCRQNGTVVGTDIAELLLRDHKTVWLPGKSPNEANLIDFTSEAVEQEEEEPGEAQLSFLTDSQTAATSSLEKETERFRELLLYGRKKDALESAMKNGLWGHALLLASKMDSRTHARVMTRFANSLPINDPLQTVYQLMSGRMPAASTCCGDEKWGDWRPHLAMVLSNLNNNMDVESRTMATMGDTLASKGLLDAAHFCYLMAQVGFGVYTKKTTKLVLIGSNHSLPFLKFATNEAIQRTEAYEYAQSLGARTCPLPSFQVFKFVYSCRLAEMGLATQAFHYCEVIAKSILPEPHRFSPVLISQLIQVASQLRLFDPQLKEKPEEEWFVEPAWLVQLQLVEKQIKEGAVVWHQEGALPQQCRSTPSSEVEDEGLEAEQPLLALPMLGAEHASRSVQLPPSAPQTLPDGQPASPAGGPSLPGPPPPGSGEPGPACRLPVSALGFPEPSGPDPAALYPSSDWPVNTLPLQGNEHLLPEAGHQHPGAVPQEPPVRNVLSELGEGHFGGAAANLDSQVPPGWECADPPPAASTSTPEVKRPVNAATKKESKEPKKKKAPPPPPVSLPKTPQAGPPGPGGPPGASVNMFSRKAAGARARYVDVLNPSGTKRSEPVLAPVDSFALLAPIQISSDFRVLKPDAENPQASGGAGVGGQVPAGCQAHPEPASETKLSRCSSMSSLSREVSQHFNQALGDHPPAGGPPAGAVPLYHPAQFAQASRTGRTGQRK